MRLQRGELEETFLTSNPSGQDTGFVSVFRDAILFYPPGMLLQELAIVVAEQYLFIEELPDLMLYIPDGSWIEKLKTSSQESNV